jgi:hypothetical protein
MIIGRRGVAGLSIFQRGGIHRLYRVDGDGGAGAGGGAGGAGASQDWRASLPPDLKDAAYLKDVPDVATLAKNYGEAMSYRGQSIRIPGPGAGDKDWGEFDGKLKERVPGLVRMPKESEKQADALREFGLVPKEGKDYSLDGVTLPEGVQFSDEQIGELRKVASKLGLTKGAFRELAQERASLIKAQADAAQAGQKALRTEWGAAYDERLAAVKGLVQQTNAPQELKDAVERGEFSTGVASWLVGLAKSLGTQPRELAGQGGNGGGQKLTPREAQARIGELMRRAIDPKTPHEDAIALVQQVNELQRFANPDLV